MQERGEWRADDIDRLVRRREALLGTTRAMQPGLGELQHQCEFPEHFAIRIARLRPEAIQELTRAWEDLARQLPLRAPRGPGRPVPPGGPELQVPPGREHPLLQHPVRAPRGRRRSMAAPRQRRMTRSNRTLPGGPSSRAAKAGPSGFRARRRPRGTAPPGASVSRPGCARRRPRVLASVPGVSRRPTPGPPERRRPTRTGRPLNVLAGRPAAGDQRTTRLPSSSRPALWLWLLAGEPADGAVSMGKGVLTRLNAAKGPAVGGRQTMRTCPPAAGLPARTDKSESYQWVGAVPGDPLWVGATPQRTGASTWGRRRAQPGRDPDASIEQGTRRGSARTAATGPEEGLASGLIIF